MNEKRFLGVALAVVLFSPAARAACSWTTLSNGTTADATAVMGNFDCLATAPSLVGPVSIAPSTTGQPASIKLQRGTMGTLASDQGGIAYVHNGGLSGTNEALVLDTGTSGNDYRLKTGGADRMVIKGSTGAVGIGTSSPTISLDVELATGNTFAKFGSNKPLYAISDSPILGFNLYYSSGWRWGKGSSSSYGGAIGVTPSSGYMDFYTTTAGNADSFATVTSRMTLTRTGDFGIGTGNPAQRLDVAGAIRQSYCTTAGTLSTNASGDIICTSDARLKNIRGDYSDGLEAIVKLSPKLFTYKPTAKNPVETFVHAGFIAQNVKQVIPQAVALQHSGYYSLDTTAILAASVNAIKELKAANDRQANEIARLRVENATLIVQLNRQTADVQDVRTRLVVLERKFGVRTAAASIRTQR